LPDTRATEDGEDPAGTRRRAALRWIELFEAQRLGSGPGRDTIYAPGACEGRLGKILRRCGSRGCKYWRMLSYGQAARALNMSVTSVLAPLASGELAACAEDVTLIDSISVEAFRDAERTRMGAILQEMAVDAEDLGLYDLEPLQFRR
jgi:hypothetical protein